MMAVPNNAVEVWLEVDETNHRALVIPLETCHISNTPNGEAITEYRPTDPVIQPGKYYYIAVGEPHWLDVDMMNDRTSYWSEWDSPLTAKQADFKQGLTDRDASCVLCDSLPIDCDACHIVPHSRGDQYIHNLAEHREASPFEGINDARNGLLLDPFFHRPFGDSRIAFLRTPNHAMDVTDVQYVLQPNAVNIGVAATKRLTLQHFESDNPALNVLAPHNCDARISESDEWPSDMVFDLSYGCAALRKWGDPAFITLLRDRIKINRARARDGGRGKGRGRGRGRGGGRGGAGAGAGAGGGAGAVGGDGEGPNGTTRAERAANRARAKEPTTADTQDDYADVVFALWAQNTTKRQRQAQVKKAERARDDVQQWLDSPQNEV